MSQAIQETYSNELEVYVNQERAAVEFLNSTGKLSLTNQLSWCYLETIWLTPTSQKFFVCISMLLKLWASQLAFFDTTDLAKDLYEMDLAPAKIDIGKLASEWLTERDRFNSRKDFLEDKLSNFMMADSNPLEPRDVVLFGFGRIGRLAARELIRQAGKGQQLRLRAIVTRKVDENQLIKRSFFARK